MRRPTATRKRGSRRSPWSCCATSTRNTVDFVPNFDDQREEPTVLPAKFPNLLVNGSSGIAVGMATNIPPHNLREVIDACIHVIDHPDCGVTDLFQFVKGPDFPTGGFICGWEGIKEAYETGRGRICHAGAHRSRGKRAIATAIIVNEMPFMVNKSRMIEQIAELVREKRITDISDLRDESDRDGIRVVIELKRDAIPQIVLNQLYKHTQMQSTFGVIMLALGRWRAEDHESEGADSPFHRASPHRGGAAHRVRAAACAGS